MKTTNKNKEAYKTIGEVTKELGLIDKKTGNLQTHTLRYWQTQFKQIKPSVKTGKRRYYSNKDMEIIKFIKFLLKEKGITIEGAKQILNNTTSYALDENVNLGVYKPDLKTTKNIKDKVRKISKIIKELKDYK
tara:strand:- start:2523 stop:2921 length:399 start_codon:yes stop_codon:yes gene_type:complete